MTLLQISASRLKTYRTCARQYEFKYIIAREDRPDQDKNIGAMLGTALHYAIEQRYRNDSNPITVFVDKMTELYEEWESKGYTIRGEEWFSKNIKDGRKILQAFEWDVFNPIALELQFLLPFPNKDNPIVLMNGYIDLVDANGSIVDHKSQKELPTQDELNHDPQFIIYAWAYQTIYGEFPTSVIWNDLRTNRRIEIDTFTDFDRKFALLVMDIEAMMQNDRFPRRMMDKICKTKCSFYSLCYGNKASSTEGV